MLSLFKKKVDKNSDAFRSLGEMIESRGFVCEEHMVQTDDGYILTVHRIINPLINEKSLRRPVLLQHGLASNSTHWLIASSDGHLDAEFLVNDGTARRKKKQVSNNLGFALSNAGYDVWMANSRGNTFSRKHKNLAYKDREFWDFSLDEMIEFDLTSTIDHVLMKTKRTSLAFIGISQGTATMFGLLASKPEYNDKVKPFIALAPLVRYKHSKSPMRLLPYVLCKTIGTGTGRGLNTDHTRSLLSGHIFEGLVHRALHFMAFFIFGFDWDQYDASRLNVFYSHPIGDFSWKSFRHHTQHYFKEDFSKYDYGKHQNLKVYGQESPPVYQLSKITCKHVCLIHGKNDMVTADEDLDYIRKSMTVPIFVDYKIPHENWNHTDFHFAKDCGHFLNGKVVEILDGLKC